MKIISAMLARLRLRAQIGLLATIGIVGLLALAAFYVLADQVTTTAEARAKQASLAYESIAAFDRGLLVAKKAEKNFLSSGRPAEIENHKVAMEDAFSAARKARAWAIGEHDQAADDIAARTAAYVDDVNGYVSAFGDIVALTQAIGGAESGPQGRMLRSAAAAQELAEKLGDPRCFAWMLLLRTNEKDFLLQVTPAFRDAFAQSFGIFTASLAASGAAAEPVAAIKSAAATYRSDFLALAPMKIDLAEKIAKISTFYSGHEARLTELRQRVLGVRDAAEVALAATRTRLRGLALWVTGGLLASVLTLASVLGAGLTAALQSIVLAMRRLSRGDREFALPAFKGRGELGGMAAALEVFRATAETAVRLRADAEAAAVAAAEEKRRAQMAMAERIEQEAAVALGHVTAMTTEMDGSAETMTLSAERTTRSAEAAGQAAAQATATAQTVASAAEELAASIGEINRQVGQATAASRKAVMVARDARGGIELLATQARRIGDVAGLINGIAGRTNLLALNATIEAARAGKAGKGFAVVAGEVKSLATQTARATESISRELAAITAATASAVAAMTLIDGTIQEVDAISVSIAAAVEEQGAATAEIARSIGATATASAAVSQLVTEMVVEAASTGARSIDMRAGIVRLDDAMQDLKSTVVRVVRMSSDEINRRHDARVDVDLPCTVRVAGGTAIAARVVDLSLGGACLRDVSAPVTGAIRLRVEGVEIDGDIVRQDPAGKVSVRFADDEAMRGALVALLARITARTPKLAA